MGMNRVHGALVEGARAVVVVECLLGKVVMLRKRKEIVENEGNFDRGARALCSLDIPNFDKGMEILLSHQPESPRKVVEELVTTCAILLMYILSTKAECCHVHSQSGSSWRSCWPVLSTSLVSQSARTRSAAHPAGITRSASSAAVLYHRLSARPSPFIVSSIPSCPQIRE